MSAKSSAICVMKASLWIALGLAGATTVAIYMASRRPRVSRSSSSARTTSGSTSPGGRQSSSRRYPTQEEWLGYASTRGAAPRKVVTSTPLSHSECWSNYFAKRDIRDAYYFAKRGTRDA